MPKHEVFELYASNEMQLQGWLELVVSLFLRAGEWFGLFAYLIFVLEFKMSEICI
jgi:hypothetical protein